MRDAVVLLIFFLGPATISLGQMSVVKEGGVYKLNYKEAGLPSNTQRKFIIRGHPFLKEEFELGQVFLNGIATEKLMRYNAYLDKFELPDSNKKTVDLIKSPDIEVKFKGNTYRYLSYIEHGNERSAYLNPLNEGHTQLFVQTRKTILPFKKPENGYEVSRLPEFVTKTMYFIKKRNRPAVPLAHLSRKEVFAVLWDKYSELRKYARKNKLHMRSEEEVIQVLDYYQSLEQDEETTNELKK